MSPNLDRLAREVLLFTRAYDNSPVCSPARFARIAGLLQYRLRGALDEPLGRHSIVLGLPPEHPTLPSLLRAAGWETALVDKWHLGTPPNFGPLKNGYAEHFVPIGGAVDYFSHLGPGGAHDLWDGDREAHIQGYLTDLITDRAVEYVSRERAGRPCFVSVHYTSPHWPWEARDDAAESARIGADIAHLDCGSVAICRRMIERMVEGIGRIVAALPAAQRDNTLVVFVGDSGGERFSNNWPFIGGKMDLLEGGLRVPQIAWWPARIAAGGRSDWPTLTMDWMPTMLAAAGVAPDAGFPPDGIDLSPLRADPAWSPERWLYWRMKHRQQAACLSGRWKYLRVDGNEYLFDVVADGRERANLAKRHPERLAATRSQWQEWAKTMLAMPDDAQVYLL